MYKLVLFDMDGTLIDSTEGISETIKYVYEMHYGTVERKSIDDLVKYSAYEIFERLLNNKIENFEEEVSKCTNTFRKFYLEGGYKMYKPYEGILKLINDLKDMGSDIGIVTLKAKSSAKKITEEMGIIDKLLILEGPELKDVNIDKCSLLKKALNDLNIYSKSDICLVGDGRSDIMAAKGNGIKSIGVTYGFNSIEYIQKLQPDYIATSVSELRKLLL